MGSKKTDLATNWLVLYSGQDRDRSRISSATAIGSGPSCLSNWARGATAIMGIRRQKVGIDNQNLPVTGLVCEPDEPEPLQPRRSLVHKIKICPCAVY